ncbi:tyrosine recombinase [bacterium 1XD8-76]|nr:tyrosine recombinase [bacterium 1XD8-76]
MEREIEAFISYLHNIKKTSSNTEMSYRRDLTKLRIYLEITAGSPAVDEVTEENLKKYMAYMERKKFKASTISRSIASIKAFYHYLLKEGLVRKDISDCLKAPRVERKTPDILSVEEMEKLLNQPSGGSDKEIRDSAMLKLLYATGIRVSELISLRVSDVNMQMGFLICREGDRERMIPFDSQVQEALRRYLIRARNHMASNEAKDILFVNCSGTSMSRQGFWKLIKSYARKAGITKDITPHTLRHTFAAHQVENGTDLKSVQEMLGHSDISTTHMYLKLGKPSVKEA